MIIRARRFFITTLDRRTTPASPRARTGKNIMGIAALLVGSARRVVFSASSDTDAARTSVGTAMGPCALTAATATAGSGHVTAGGAAPCGLVSDNVLLCGAGTSGVDTAFSSCVLCWEVLSVVP